MNNADLHLQVIPEVRDYVKKHFEHFEKLEKRTDDINKHLEEIEKIFKEHLKNLEDEKKN